MRRRRQKFVQKNFLQLALIHDLFEQINVAGEGFAAGFGERTGREGTVVLVGLGHGDEAFFLQDADVRGEITVSHAERVTEFSERQFRRGRERGHDRKPSLLVDDAVKLEKQFRIHATGFFFSVK